MGDIYNYWWLWLWWLWRAGVVVAVGGGVANMAVVVVVVAVGVAAAAVIRPPSSTVPVHTTERPWAKATWTCSTPGQCEHG